jgi:hypothetical protein
MSRNKAPTLNIDDLRALCAPPPFIDAAARAAASVIALNKKIEEVRAEVEDLTGQIDEYQLHVCRVFGYLDELWQSAPPEEDVAKITGLPRLVG